MRKLLLSMGLALVGALGCAPDESTSVDLVCPDPAEGEVDDACGVWASNSLGDDANAGTRDKPVASLAHAIELAALGEGRVYVCGEIWTGTVELPGHVSMFSGFDCAHGWEYRGYKARAALTAGPDEVPLKIVGLGGESVVSNFFIQSVDAVAPSGSSIAVFVTGSVAATIIHCEIIAGHGADGLNGEPDEVAATDGPPGYPGMAACSAEVNKGGLSPVNACPPDAAPTGGKGGDAELAIASAGTAGLPAPDPKDPGNPLDGDGGSGEKGAVSCAAGEPGAAGAEGDFGLGGQSLGRLSPDGYVGVPGQDGKPGAPGQGGGGGGGTLGSVLACGGSPPAATGGGAGGAGGAGGCGGRGGKGGQPGGSSIAIASRSPTLTIGDTSLDTGNGGRGGDGAPGQKGGQGGAPGQGGAGMGTIAAGCSGGSGGNGGNGGAGGGGIGGSSIAMVTAKASYVSFLPGLQHRFSGIAGDGGKGGDPVHYQGNALQGAQGLETSMDL